MQDPSNGVVDYLGVGESLVTTLMCENPDTSGDETGSERVHGPKSEGREGVQEGVRKVDVLWCDTRVQENCTFVNDCKQEEVPDAVKQTRQTRFERVKHKEKAYT